MAPATCPTKTTYPGRVRRTYAWLRGHPRAADCMLAILMLAGGAEQIPARPLDALATVIVDVLLALTVIARRAAPVLAFAAAAVIALAQVALSHSGPAGLGPGVTDLAVVIGLYTLAAYRPHRVSLIGLAVCLAGGAIAIAQYAPLHASDAGPILLLSIAALGLTLIGAWVLGDSMAHRRAYEYSLEERLAVAERARELEVRRARAVDNSAARLRRIERDLHDGAQVRLAALAMTLGEIKENLEQSAADHHTLGLVGAAHQNAKDTLAELRDLARGIHPPVLDRGLGPALGILAGTSAIPVALTVAVTERPSPAIEAIAYFCTAELLANVTKHSGASHVTIGVSEPASGLTLTVTDDGHGGARLVPGGGLAGLLERVQTVDGRLEVESPPGGPTIITIELPRHA